jgi:hypothetical protein
MTQQDQQPSTRGLLAALAEHGPPQTVLVAGSPASRPERLIATLADLGHRVVGPAPTASLALAMAAQTPLDTAIVFRRLAGRRDGRRLARRLEETWGVRTMVIDHDAGD